MAFLRILNACGIAASALAVNPSMDPSGSFLNRMTMKVAAEGDLADALELHQNLDGLMADLEPVFNALPKDKQGRIGFPLVRYALHRTMVDRHGWHIRGLAPDGKDMKATSPEMALQDWAPAQLREALVKRFGNGVATAAAGNGGLTLKEVAAVAAMIEDVADREADTRLSKLYSLYNLSTSLPVEQKSASDAFDAFMLVYINAINYHPTNYDEAVDQLEHFRALWKGWEPMERWIRKVERNFTLGASKVSWREAQHVVEEVGRRYVNYDANVCHDLKEVLMRIGGTRQTGRVPLANFYSQAMTKDTFFRFTESVEYLRDLGVLDESDASNPSVIIPNYITSRTQCLEASHLYAVCCRSDCENNMRKLETQLAKSAAKPSEITAIVEQMSTETVKGPRKLSAQLLQHLQKIAAVHDGLVPLHGRLFTQFMHHAFPNECNYPHEAGTTNPRAPEDWMKHTGRNSTEASPEEMRQHVERTYRVVAADGSMATAEAGISRSEPAAAGSQAAVLQQLNVSDLPWTDTEELLVVYSPAVAAAGGKSAWGLPGGLLTFRTVCGAAGILSVLSLVMRFLTSAARA